MSSAVDEHIHDQIASHLADPSSKGAFGPVRIPVFDFSGNRHQDLLSKVASIGILQPLSAGKPVDERFVDVDELTPRLAVPPISQANQQAGSSFGCILHRTTSRKGYSTPTQKSFRETGDGRIFWQHARVFGSWAAGNCLAARGVAAPSRMRLGRPPCLPAVSPPRRRGGCQQKNGPCGHRRES